jgi:drug/metabolite transporter (DMT)-like permease
MVIDMNMHLYYAIGFSGIGVMLMLRYYNGAGVATMILGIICMVLGSIHGKKWQDGREK